MTPVKPGLDIHLPADEGEELILLPAGGELVRRRPGELPPSLASSALWTQLWREPDRRVFLEAAGQQLCAWLLGDEGIALVQRCQQDARDGARRRIALHVPERLAGFPWEAAHDPRLRAPLGVDEALTVVRAGTGARAGTHPGRSVLLVGVETVANAAEPALATGAECEQIRQTLSSLPQGWVGVDAIPDGSWRDLEQRIAATAPPTVFHFAGHAGGEGERLVFRGDDGTRAPIDAGRLAELLTRRDPCRLVVLNACRTGTTAAPELAPFGSVAARLVRHGVAAVIGHQAPIADQAATQFARQLYETLASGESTEVAAQLVRRYLYSVGGTGTEWPFVMLAVAGTPEPVFQPLRAFGDQEIEDLHHELAFLKQRAQLRKLARERASFVAVVHGPHHGGHRYVHERLRADLARSAHTVCHPIAAMPWYIGGHQLLNQGSMLGAIAASAQLPSRGSIESLQASIATWMQRSCAGNRTLVLDVIDVCSVASRSEADALIELVTPVWHELAARANVAPIVLLMSIGYPPGFGSILHRMRARKAVAKLGKLRLEKAAVAIQIADELHRIETDEVITFFTDKIGDNDRDARDTARILAVLDNELLLEQVLRILRDRTTP